MATKTDLLTLLAKARRTATTSQVETLNRKAKQLRQKKTQMLVDMEQKAGKTIEKALWNIGLCLSQSPTNRPLVSVVENSPGRMTAAVPSPEHSFAKRLEKINVDLEKIEVERTQAFLEIEDEFEPVERGVRLSDGETEAALALIKKYLKVKV